MCALIFLTIGSAEIDLDYLRQARGTNSRDLKVQLS